MTLHDVATAAGVFRAGGTDLMSRAPGGPYVDLHGVPELGGITWRPDGSAVIGALTTVADLARDVRLRAAYPALALTAAGLATPQIREAGTLGGNLLQRNRCAYYRSPAFSCHQDGGDSCPARDGLTLYATVVDSGPCVAPHPSSLAMTLLGYDATAEVYGRGELEVAGLYDDDPTRDHRLARGEILVSVRMPPPTPGERAAYHRAIARSEAEWPLVEAAARLVVADDAIVFAAVTVGGVARTPLRLPEVESALLAGESLAEAAGRAEARCAPQAQTGYKVALLTGTILHVLEAAVEGEKVAA
ncbi:FAD binding domain-containing protein [Streptosporangium soli]|nr:FAD binding domain-containing protein [Streptosporangium sp. KLBMP 9127]